MSEMNDPGWDKIVDSIDSRFGIKDHGRRTEPLEDKPQLEQQVAYIVFEAGDEEYKFERVSRPAVAEQKSIYNKAAGTRTGYQNIYDEDSVTHRTLLFRRSGSEWEEIDAESLSL